MNTSSPNCCSVVF